MHKGTEQVDERRSVTVSFNVLVSFYRGERERHSRVYDGDSLNVKLAIVRTYGQSMIEEIVEKVARRIYENLGRLHRLRPKA